MKAARAAGVGDVSTLPCIKYGDGRHACSMVIVALFQGFPRRLTMSYSSGFWLLQLGSKRVVTQIDLVDNRNRRMKREGTFTHITKQKKRLRRLGEDGWIAEEEGCIGGIVQGIQTARKTRKA